MTKAEATTIVANEYASWVHDTVNDRYFYEWVEDEGGDLAKALSMFNGHLPNDLQLNVTVRIDHVTGEY